MAEVLHVKLREDRGTRAARRLRAAGRIPAVLYGHGGENVTLSVPLGEISAAIRHGTQLVELTGALEQNALIREAQWDPLGAELLHIDFARVEVGESVETTVPVELRGEAPGTRQGGIIEHVMHEVELECPVTAIPESLVLNINELQVGHSLTAADLPLPEGAKLLIDPATPVVNCAMPAEEVEEEEIVPTEGIEPELIGRKAGEAEQSE